MSGTYSNWQVEEICTLELIERILKIGFKMESVLQIPLEKLIEGKIEIDGLYNRLKMLFKAFLDHYDTKVILGRLEPIERLPAASKRFYWDEAGKVTEEREERLKVVKVLYVIDLLITKKHGHDL